jgi:hypothetical protein
MPETRAVYVYVFEAEADWDSLEGDFSPRAAIEDEATANGVTLRGLDWESCDTPGASIGALLARMARERGAEQPDSEH